MIVIKNLKFNLFILFVIFTFKYKQSMEEAKGITRTVATAEDPSLVRCFRGH